MICPPPFSKDVWPTESQPFTLSVSLPFARCTRCHVLSPLLCHFFISSAASSIHISLCLNFQHFCHPQSVKSCVWLSCIIHVPFSFFSTTPFLCLFRHLSYVAISACNSVLLNYKLTFLQYQPLLLSALISKHGLPPCGHWKNIISEQFIILREDIIKEIITSPASDSMGVIRAKLKKRNKYIKSINVCRQPNKHSSVTRKNNYTNVLLGRARAGS